MANFQELNNECAKHLSDLIQKVLEISKFKEKFKNNPEDYFTSRKLFVTFKCPSEAWAFKTLYNNSYKFQLSNFFKAMPVDLRKLKTNFDANSKKEDSKDVIEEFTTLIHLDDSDKKVHLTSEESSKYADMNSKFY
jgi:hypothetical protein